MTDPRPDRLQRWFAGQLARAEQDIRRGLLTAPQAVGGVRRGQLGRRRATGGLVIASAATGLVVLALVGGLLGGAAGPSPSLSSAGGPTSTTNIVFGGDGLPVVIDGEPVLTPSEAIAQARVATDDARYLVAGWLDGAKASCPMVPRTPKPALLDIGMCGGQPALLSTADGTFDGGDGLSVIFLDGSSPLEPQPAEPLSQPTPPQLAVALRVHTHDPAAASCDPADHLACEQATVVDAVLWRSSNPTPTAPGPSASAGVYADGIPATIDGQPVLRPTQAASATATASDATSFLVGGWLRWDGRFCAFEPSSPDTRLLADCGPPWLVETAALAAPGLLTPDPIRLHLLDPLTLPNGGPVVLRVHTHDPLAASCSPADRDACEAAIVVDSVVWDGPVFGADGLPTWIGGQATLTVAEAQATLAASTDPTPILVRGWFAGWALPCPSIPASQPPAPTSALLPDHCQPNILAPQLVSGEQVLVIPSDLDLTLGPGVDGIPPSGQVVLRLHGHDPAAAACAPSIRATCEAAIVVDSVVWSPDAVAPASSEPGAVGAVLGPDGLPTSIAGEPVLRGAAFTQWVGDAIDGTSFLVGGWAPAQAEAYACYLNLTPAPGATPDPVTVLHPCGPFWFFDGPVGETEVPAGSSPWVAQPVDVWDQPPVWGKAFVMRVHVHDPLAASCPAADRQACERAVVEESLVWVGP